MNETLAQKIINSFDPRAALTGGRALTLAEAKDIVVRAARGDRMARFWADQVKSGTISIGMDERTGTVYFGMPVRERAAIPAGMPSANPQPTEDASVDELRAERSQLRIQVARLEDELAEIAEELHLEREDLGGGLCGWWLPAEPGPVECESIAEAVREANRLGKINLRRAESRAAMLERECAPYRAALEEAQAPPRPAVMSEARIATEISPALHRLGDAQRNPLSVELLHARHALVERIRGLMEEVETATALRLAAGHAERSDSPVPGAPTDKLAGRIWAEVRKALLARPDAPLLHTNDAELDALASEYTDRIVAVIATATPAGAEHGEARERATDRLRTVVMYLLGRGKLEGRWFGEDPPEGAGRYWWRAELQEAFFDVAVGDEARDLVMAAQRVVAQFASGALVCRPGEDDEWVRAGIAALNDALPEPSRVVVGAALGGEEVGNG